MVGSPDEVRSHAAGVDSGSLKSKRRKSASAGKRSASIIFLGVWLLVNTGKGSFSHQSTESGHVGVVLESPFTGDHTPDMSLSPANRISWYFTTSPVLSSPGTLHAWSPPTTERIIGRVSAWVCTTLYLTSRLPQIWKNFSRKSVEGLTMSLFICAFFGNLFYVASILTNPTMDEPAPISTEYISESIPYLLGSGGTLLFDVTIVAQSFIYRGLSPVHEPLTPSTSTRRVSRHRSRSLGDVFERPEVEPLLREDRHGKGAEHGYGGTRGRFRNASTRSESISISPDIPIRNTTVERS